MSEISINNSITVRDHEIIDDLELIDDKVVTKIVDALFTTIIPDFSQDDSNAPDFIKNKPTKTSDFINDGENGNSKYVEYKDITDLNKVIDVQVNETGLYNSVVKDKIAKIDLSTYVKKEFKTGSTTEYKVLSDNNFSNNDKSKLDKIITNGTGSKVLTDKGTYEDNYNILKVNGVLPNQDKEIIINTQDIKYGARTLRDELEETVKYKSQEDKTIVMNNNKAIVGLSAQGSEANLIKIDKNEIIQVGDITKDININADKRPTINSYEEMAYISDIDDEIKSHNESETAHQDIREDITFIRNKELMQLTNSEMSEYLQNGGLENDQLVVPKDNGMYRAGKIYKFSVTITIEGTRYAFLLVSNWQVENMYANGKPTTSTTGVLGQQYWDIANKKIYRLKAISSGQYIWEDITPVGNGGSSEDLQRIINNTTLISDNLGGFTAGNNYRLLDGDGIIPTERIPQAVLNGLVYGGSFNGNGVITASKSNLELQGQNISEISVLNYKNRYFLCTENYTLEGEDYIPGNFALSTGLEWVPISNSGQVVSVNGKDGVVVLNAANVGALSLEQADKDVIEELNIVYSGDNVYLNKQFINIANEDKTELSEQLKLASDTQAGLMSTADYNQIRDNTSRIEALEGKTTRLLYTAKPNPTAEEINTFVTGLGYTVPFEGIAVVIDDTYHIWHYYENNSIGWKDDGVDTVTQFTNNALGTIKGAEVDGKIFAETDGTGSVYGWATLKGAVSDIARNLSSYVLKTTTVAGKELSSNVTLEQLKITKGGADYTTYNGSQAVTIDIPEGIDLKYSNIQSSQNEEKYDEWRLNNQDAKIVLRSLFQNNETTISLEQNYAALKHAGSTGSANISVSSNNVVLESKDLTGNITNLSISPESATLNGNNIITSAGGIFDLRPQVKTDGDAIDVALSSDLLSYVPIQSESSDKYYSQVSNINGGFTVTVSQNGTNPIHSLSITKDGILVDNKAIGTEVNIDNTTINKNTQDQLQAVALKNVTDDVTINAEEIWLACTIEREV